MLFLDGFTDLYGTFSATATEHDGSKRITIDHVLAAGLTHIVAWSSKDDIDKAVPVHAQFDSDHRPLKSVFESPSVTSPIIHSSGGVPASVSTSVAVAVGGGSAAPRKWPVWMDTNFRERSPVQNKELALAHKDIILARALADEEWLIANLYFVNMAKEILTSFEVRAEAASGSSSVVLRRVDTASASKILDLIRFASLRHSAKT